MTTPLIDTKSVWNYLAYDDGVGFVFDFPWLEQERKLHIELKGTLPYLKNPPKAKRKFDIDALIREEVAEQAVKAYQERSKK